MSIKKITSFLFVLIAITFYSCFSETGNNPSDSLPNRLLIQEIDSFLSKNKDLYYLKSNFENDSNVRFFSSHGINEQNLYPSFQILLYMKKYQYLDSLLQEYKPKSNLTNIQKEINLNLLRYHASCSIGHIANNINICDYQYSKTEDSTFLFTKYSMLTYVRDDSLILQELETKQKNKEYEHSEIFWYSIKQMVKQNPNGMTPDKYNPCKRIRE